MLNMSRRVARTPNVLQPGKVKRPPQRLSWYGSNNPASCNPAALRKPRAWVFKMFKHLQHEHRVKAIVSVGHVIDRLHANLDITVALGCGIHQTLLHIPCLKRN